MKTIKPSIYEKLTTRQRVIATIEAEARRDKEEVKRLVTTCPQKTYAQTDADYTDALQEILAVSMVVKAEISDGIIGFLASII